MKEVLDRVGDWSCWELCWYECCNFIFDVVQQMFLENGYFGIMMFVIVVKLGGLKGMLWYYFSLKEILFIFVFDCLVEQFWQGLMEMFNFDIVLEMVLCLFC